MPTPPVRPRAFMGQKAESGVREWWSDGVLENRKKSEGGTNTLLA